VQLRANGTRSKCAEVLDTFLYALRFESTVGLYSQFRGYEPRNIPVILPRGRARLLTYPFASGSLSKSNATTGMLVTAFVPLDALFVQLDLVGACNIILGWLPMTDLTEPDHIRFAPCPEWQRRSRKVTRCSVSATKHSGRRRSDRGRLAFLIAAVGLDCRQNQTFPTVTCYETDLGDRGRRRSPPEGPKQTTSLEITAVTKQRRKIWPVEGAAWSCPCPSASSPRRTSCGPR
jgi:hypothetical protein